MAPDLPLRAVLRNGEIVLIREIGPEDRRLMREGFDKLSNQSRFFRFLAPHGDLSEAELDRFTEENTDEHFAIGAASVGVETDMPLATARYVRVSEGANVAEFALTIIDSHQKLGLGSLLLRCLADVAVDSGITGFRAVLHHGNTGMKALLRSFGGYKTEVGAEEDWYLPLPLTVAAKPGRQPSLIAIRKPR